MHDKVNRTAVRKSKIEEPLSDFEYWRRQPCEESLRTLEAIRREYHGWKVDTQPGLQRIVRIIKRT